MLYSVSSRFKLPVRESLTNYPTRGYFNWVVKRNPNSFNPYNPQIYGKYHPEVLQGRCDRFGCEMKSCGSIPCGKIVNLKSLLHGTSNTNVKLSPQEQEVKEVKNFGPPKFNGEAKDQAVIIYKTPIDTTLADVKKEQDQGWLKYHQEKIDDIVYSNEKHKETINK